MCVQVCECAVLVWPLSGELNDDAQLLLNALMAHGLPTVVNVVHGLSTLTSGKAKEVARKNVTRLLER